MPSFIKKLMRLALGLGLLPVSAHPPQHHHLHSYTTQQQPNQVTITTENDYRFIHANGIPDHPHGEFPNSSNPNAISAQSYRFRIPLHPEKASTITPVDLSPFGIALNGIPFDPAAAEFWKNNPHSGWQYEALSGKINLGFDDNNAHVQPGGEYHYHGLPTGLIQKLSNQKTSMILLGYAADGFPIYTPYGYVDPHNPKSELKKMRPSYQLKKGTRPHGPGGPYDGTFVQDYRYIPQLGDLDECNGRFGITPEYPQGTYHYFITETFPFIPRYFRGTPDPSFQSKGPPRYYHRLRHSHPPQY